MAPTKPKLKGKAHSTDERPLFNTSAAPLKFRQYDPPPVEFASSSTSWSAKPNGKAPSTDQPRPSSPPGSPFKSPPPNPPSVAFGAPSTPGNATSVPDFKFDVTPTEGEFKRLNDLLIAKSKRLEEANEKYHKDNTKCYGDIQSLTQSYRFVSSTLEGEQVKNKRLENEVEKLDMDKLRLQHDLDDFKEEHDVAIDKCAAAELNVKNATDQLRGARYLKEEAEKENTTLLKQIVRAEDQMARWKKLIETLKPEGPIHDHEMLMKLGKGLAEANDALEKAENERDRIQDACEDLQKSNEYYEKDNLRLEEEKTVLYNEKEQLKERIEDSNTDRVVDLTRLTDERNRFEVQIGELQQEQKGIIDEHKRTVEALGQQIATISTERKVFGKQAEEFVKKKIAQITADRESIIKDGEKYVQETSKTIESQQAEIAKLKENNKAGSEQYEEWRQEGHAMLETLRGRDVAQKKQIAQLEADRKNSSQLDASKDVEEAIAERNKMIEAKDGEIARLTDANKNAESEYNSLQKRAEEVVAERDSKIQEQASIIDDQKHGLNIRDTSVSEHQVFIQAKESELAALRNESIRAAAKIENIEGINRDLQIEKDVLEKELAEVKAARNVETSNIDGPERPFDDENFDEQGGRKVEDLQEELTAMKAVLEAKDRAIAELKAVDRNVSDQEDLTDTKDGHSTGESGPDTELQRKLAASESALIECRAQEAAQKSVISELQSQCIELSEDLATSKTKFEAIVQGCERRIESQKKELAELGAANDGHLEKEQALSNENTDLNSKLQEAINKGKSFAYQEKQLEKAIEERDATIRKHEQTIEGLKDEAQDLKAQVNVYEDERAEAKNPWKGKETKSDTDFAKEKRRLTEEFEKRLAARECWFQKHIDEDADACNKTLLILQGIQGELQKDANEVHRKVAELRQKTNDLERELEAYREGAKTKDDESNVADGPSRNELGRFSLSVSPMHLEQRGRVLQPRRRQRELWGSDSEATEDEEPIPRRGHHSSDKSIVSVQNASTQVDNSSWMSDSTTQTTSSSEPAVIEVAIQTKRSKTSMAGEMATQTEPESVLDIKLAISPSISNAETQTMPREKTIPLWWRLLYYFLLCLMILMFFGSLWLSESARRERAMWQAANEYTRRAAFSVQGGGGTGTWVPAWLWREPLIEMSTRQY
ncbi:MAG: hypothetical protein Q9210_003593 [Variospora velana]